MKHRTFSLICAAAALALSQAASASPSPDAKSWSGTWQLNLAKSKFSSAEYTPKKETRSYKVAGNVITMHSNMVTGAGKPISWGYSAAANGKWFTTTGNPNSDHVALTAVSARSLKFENRLKGKPSASGDVTVSGDGKELTVNRRLVTPKGTTDDTIVYDRVK